MKDAKKFVEAIFSGKHDPKNAFNKNDLRAFIYDAKKVDDDGKEISEDGKHHPWPHFLYRSRITGELIGQKKYQQLDEGKKIGYYKVKTLQVIADGEYECLCEDTDMSVINKTFVRLVQCGDPAEAALSDEVAPLTAETVEVDPLNIDPSLIKSMDEYYEAVSCSHKCNCPTPCPTCHCK